jgi:hypothetical protein
MILEAKGRDPKGGLEKCSSVHGGEYSEPRMQTPLV